MFTTYFYILILLIQSFITESNFDYNKKIQLVNAHVLIRENKEALRLIKLLKRKSIFTNNDLARIDRRLSLKVNQAVFESDFHPRLMSDYIIKSLGFYQKNEFASSLEFTKSSLETSVVSDTLIKLYEILAENAPAHFPSKQKKLESITSKNIQLNEAMNLLDLMKRKEKTLF